MSHWVSTMSQSSMPWSYYAVILTFGIFFASLNIYILTLWLSHPFANPLWLIGVVIGAIGLIYSIRMVRVHQRELVEKKLLDES
ncbi:MAG: hypothetical protein ACW98U_00020 [Candidatus Thorarchaeota archaeon]|jgi:tetrahydromethanopterin S-methyltransferase subunit E